MGSRSQDGLVTSLWGCPHPANVGQAPTSSLLALRAQREPGADREDEVCVARAKQGKRVGPCAVGFKTGRPLQSQRDKEFGLGPAGQPILREVARPRSAFREDSLKGPGAEPARVTSSLWLHGDKSIPRAGMNTVPALGGGGSCSEIKYHVIV